MESRTRILALALVAILVGGGALAYPSVSMWWRVQSLPPAVDRDVTYAADVVPILEEHCYECHGDDRRKGGLNLDTRDMLMRGGKTGAVVEDGDSASSNLVHRIGGITPDAPMPPSNKPQLTADQVGVLRAWIDQGLNWRQDQ